MDIDQDQSDQIELHFDLSCKGDIPFGKLLTMIGEYKKKKSGYNYSVWGLSSDPSTWVEKNNTLPQAPERQLRRLMKKVEVCAYQSKSDSDN